MGTYRPPMVPHHQGPDGMVSIPGMPSHPMGVPILPHHLPPSMPGFPGIPYLGKNGFCASPPYHPNDMPLQLLPVCQTNSLEGLPVPQAQVLYNLTPSY